MVIEIIKEDCFVKKAEMVLTAKELSIVSKALGGAEIGRWSRADVHLAEEMRSKIRNALHEK